jgi:dTDP-3-amino-3,4,6-trideoxy-alpha-D-glucose transaminase
LNSRLDELHAAVLRSALLPRLPGALARRSEIATRYQQEIENEDLAMLSSPTSSTWHIFPVFVAEPQQRDSLREHLNSHGVQSAIHYPILAPAQEALTRPQNPEMYPVAHRLAQTEVSLPLHPYLTDDDVTRVITAANQWRTNQ